MRSDGIDKAIRIQHSVVANHVQRIRRRHPGATPGEIVAALEKKYVATVTSTGAAVGAAAAAPRIGPAVALALTVAESTALLEATALFTLAVADVHGMPVHDTERRRMLLLAIVFGTGGPGLASSGKRIRRWLVARYVTKRWILAISKILPFGIGAGVRPCSADGRPSDFGRCDFGRCAADHRRAPAGGTGARGAHQRPGASASGSSGPSGWPGPSGRSDQRGGSGHRKVPAAVPLPRRPRQ
jgi:hypothetical protein